MLDEPTPEEEDKIIEKVAQFIVKKRLELPASIFLMGSMPFCFIGGQLGRFYLSPYLYALGNFGLSSNHFIATFEKRKNIIKLRARIEELVAAYDLEEKKLKRDKMSTKKKE